MQDINDRDRKSALYVRVSTSNQADEGESLDEQTNTLKNFCIYRKWDNYTVYREEGYSGKNFNRPAFQQMLIDINKGNINTVIVKKVDRLSRSIIDFENLYKTFETKNVDLISLQENFDTSSAMGRCVLRIILSFAQLEREQTSERTIDVMAYRAKQGLFNGGYPRLGYDIDYENKCLIINESEVPIVNEIFKTYLLLGSLSETAITFNNKGYRMKSWMTKSGVSRGGEKFQKNNISRILNDHIYIGKVRYKNQIYDGQHQAIINEGLFEDAQAMLHANLRTKTGYRQSENTYYLKGLVRCGVCNSAMTPSFTVSKGNKYFYYRCINDNDSSKNPCRVGSVNARRLEELVINELNYLTENPLIIDGVVENATTDKKERLKELNAKRKSLNDKMFQIDIKAKNLVDALGNKTDRNPGSSFILKVLIDLELQNKQLKNELGMVELEANEIETRVISAEIIRDNFRIFKEIYNHLTNDEKYDLLHLLIKKIAYYEEQSQTNEKEKRGKIDIEFWELPQIDTSKISIESSFVESMNWLPR